MAPGLQASGFPVEKRLSRLSLWAVHRLVIGHQVHLVPAAGDTGGAERGFHVFVVLVLEVRGEGRAVVPQFVHLDAVGY